VKITCALSSKQERIHGRHGTIPGGEKIDVEVETNEEGLEAGGFIEGYCGAIFQC